MATAPLGILPAVEPQAQTTSVTTAATRSVLATLAAAQFLMALDASVMNVSIASVAEDLGTTVSGVQTAITLYTLVMASLMITGGKLGAILGRRRAFVIGTVIYAAGSLTTGLAPNLTVLIIGWSGLEGIGAALIMPAVVALVAGNVAPERRTAAYGMIAAAGAMAVAVGPIIGGAVTTAISWRWVFYGEVVVAAGILLLARRMQDAPPGERPRIDVVGVVLSIAGLGSLVFGLLRSSSWGWVLPKPGAPELLGVSPTLWLVAAGLVLLWAFLTWEGRVEDRGGEPLVRRASLRNRRLTGGLTLFGFQFFLQAGTFFTIPLFLSVVLGFSAFETGLRLLPLSIALLIAAAGIPKLFPQASPRRVTRIGLLLIIIGIGIFVAGLEPGANAGIVAIPLFLCGLGVGALSSQLGAVCVSSVDEADAPEVGGLQNTITNLGASLGTALVGSVLIAALTASLITGIEQNTKIPQQVRSQASVKLAGGVPFLSDAQLEQALTEAGASPEVTAEIVNENMDARYAALRSSLSIVLIAGILGLFFTGGLPTRPPGSDPEPQNA
ncbi:unannotated protein [freshwater metagenome]|uniref:Unannotated protein n=1 Tax=freshwater metagenome TaxID=449393 RepID=A0A6J7EFE8_9ZZZZ|nr:MFS transporter [Actinomycetota bacterium]